jgi:ketosteroid isomerase-like protein
MQDDNIQFAKDYLRAIEDGETIGLRKFLTPDALQEEYPNRLTPNGARRALADIIEASVRGQAALRAQSFTIERVVADGDRVAMEVRWRGELKIALGALHVGDVMKARFAMFLDFKDGKIAHQRNYDCIDPFWRAPRSSALTEGALLFLPATTIASTGPPSFWPDQRGDRPSLRKHAGSG